jgi:RHS repeat-associated protein
MAETGLNQNVFRDYDPLGGGRYIESDPIGLRCGSYSLYAYVGDSPIIRVDPFGLDWSLRGSWLNQFFQDRIPNSWCDIWPPSCTADSIKCVAARCRYKDCHGNHWDIVVYSWVPERPTPEQVSKETPECTCIDHIWRPVD